MGNDEYHHRVLIAYMKFLAGLASLLVARFRLEIAATEAAHSVSNFANAMRDFDVRLQKQEFQDIRINPHRRDNRN